MRCGWLVRVRSWSLAAGLCLALSGCTSLREYIHNGFKVGPNYQRPAAPASARWIDAADKRLHSEPTDDINWWTTFHDPVLNDLVRTAYQQNLPLREAGFRVLQARFQLFIAVGAFFPQTQQAYMDYMRQALSTTVANRSYVTQRWFNIEDLGFNLSWELDFWGQFRRSILAAEDNYNASIEDYDAALVTLIGDLGTYYTQLRVAQAKLAYVRTNLELQRKTLELTTIRFKGGAVSDLDVEQAKLNVAQTEAQIPALEISIRQANNRLCVLLGIPMEDLQAKLGSAPIPASPTEVTAGVSADLIGRRPDLRAAERHVAAQNEQIGIAWAQLYPHLGINGQVGYQTSRLGLLFNDQSIYGSWGPYFQWNVLNYGRLYNQIRVAEASYQALIADYQNKTLTANEEVENGLVQFLRSQDLWKAQKDAVAAAEKSVELVVIQYREGKVDFNRVYLLERQLVDTQVQFAQAYGDITLGLIQIYRALGGGWQLRDPANPENPMTRVFPPAPAESGTPKDTEPADLPAPTPVKKD